MQRGLLCSLSRRMMASRVSSMQTPAGMPPPPGPFVKGKIIRTNEGKMGYSSGMLGVSSSGDLVSDDAVGQAEQSLVNLQALAEANGFSLDDVVKNTIFLTDMGDFASVNEVYSRYFTAEEPPARSCVAVKQLPKGAKFEMESVFFKE